MPIRPPTIKNTRPLVGVVVDGVSGYGRDVLGGVLRYANLQRRWVLHKDLWTTGSLDHFPACDGAIIGGVGAADFDLIRSHCRCTILCSGGGDPRLTPVVALDDEAIGRLAAEHLLDCQLDQFGFYGYKHEWGVSHTRLAGFRAALDARGHDCLVCPVEWPTWHAWISHEPRPDLIAWLKELPKPVGIMAVDDMAAHDLADACLEADIPVPEQVAIIGVNNDELLCAGAWPPLSSVDADYTQVGYHAAKMLDRMLAGEELSPEERCLRLPPLGVVQRQSTSTLAVEDPHLADAIRYIREHACDPCSVQDVLRDVPVGRRWLERQFTQHLGRTPLQEIHRVRIDTACRLLRQPDLAIPDVALRCGFAAIQTFYDVFRRFMNTSPSAYRRKVLSGESSGGPTRRET